MPNPSGVILYQGPSVLDGQPIINIATFKSSNSGTGNMIQTWIMRSDVNPVEATKTGDDVSVCGNCPHRWYNGGACYVNVGQAPNGVFKAFHRGVYPHYEPHHNHLFEGRSIRLGAYGDPAASPYEIWRALIALCRMHTGYTHQIRHRNFDSRIERLCMVSADTPTQAIRFIDEGRNTFRVKRPEQPLLDGEQLCPKQLGNKCLDCMLCSGISRANIAIDVHGSRQARF